MADECEFSLVIPAFNEAHRIVPSLERLTEYLGQSGVSHEITVVDDGSTDDTLALCTRYSSEHPAMRVMGYPVNRGKGYAVKMGVLHSSGRLVAFGDADLPVPPEDFARFIGALGRGSYDMAIGSRYLPSSSWDTSANRKLMGTAFRLAVQLIVGTRVSDTQFGFKLFTSRAASELFSSLTIEGFAFDAEIVRLAHRRGYRIVELPVRGESAPGSTVRPFHDAVAMLLDLLSIRLRRKAARRLRGETGRFPGVPMYRA
ncbi:MAG TPA: dolichyl-phosphate beta-glucosyltransferase [Chloroflexota bacterium]|nr:dolichyl-phosphate beta-glucosyltransferase [Chloroflexota bacterium]